MDAKEIIGPGVNVGVVYGYTGDKVSTINMKSGISVGFRVYGIIGPLGGGYGANAVPIFNSKNKMNIRKDLLLLVPIVTGSILLAILFVRKDELQRKEMKFLIENELAGILVSYKDSGRGTLTIEVETKSGIVEYDLFGFKQYMYKIKAGDSLYKEMHSDVLKVYRKSNQGVFEFHTNMPPLGKIWL